jgi:formylmethanofuran dehydrogenase subunit A
MLTRLMGGSVYDPLHGQSGQVQDLYLRDDRIVSPPLADEPIDQAIDVTGCILMAGAIDMHTHIGGGKLNIARQLLPEQQRRARCATQARIADPIARSAQRFDHLQRGGTDGFLPSSFIAGTRYAQMGYSACFEPAVLPSGARLAHYEMADVPMVDTGGYVLLGNDTILLELLSEAAPQSQINDYVAWMVTATQCLGVKVVNPGGIDAFKWNARQLDIDAAHPHYGITPRQIIHSLTTAVDQLGLPHPLHVHTSNLGVPGNWESTLKTIEAAAGNRIHLAHAQFHSYGNDGPWHFSSQAASIASAINATPRATLDVGQILFGQTVTVSADAMHQYGHHKLARPERWNVMDFDCQAGCGVVPFRYRRKRFVHGLQWAIGLELLLLIDDPWRVFLTTDHPNGGPFTFYPHLIRLLMDRSFRESVIDQLPKESAEASQLRGISRQYTLEEIAILTRAGPARVLGLRNHGHLAVGAIADVVCYRPNDDFETMFAHPALVVRRGQVVLRDGLFVGSAQPRCFTSRPPISGRVTDWLGPKIAAHYGVQPGNFRITDTEMAESIGRPVETVPLIAT